MNLWNFVDGNVHKIIVGMIDMNLWLMIEDISNWKSF